MKVPVVAAIAGLLGGAVWGWVDRIPVERRPPHSSVAPKETSVAARPPLTLPEPAPNEPGAAHLQLLERIASASRGDLVALTRELCAGKPDPDNLAFLWERWLDVDPEGGFRALLAGDFGLSDRMRQVVSYLGKWSVRDPDKAIAAALTLPQLSDRHGAVSRISQIMAAHRPADFFRKYAELSKLGGSDFWIKTAAANLAFIAPSTVAGFLVDPPGGLKLADHASNDLYEGLATGWARNDPHAALDFFRKLSDAETRTLGLDRIARAIIARDQDLAAAITKESQGIHAMQGPAEALALTDPEGALAWLKKHFPSEAVVASALAFQQIPRSAGAAVDFISRHAEVLFPAGAPVRGLPMGWFVDDPAAALALTERLRDPDMRSKARTIFLDLMAFSDPEAAITTAHAGPERNRILNTAMENWAKHDITAASDWLAAQPADAVRDDAIAGLLEVTVRVEPEAALPWALAISNPGKRIRGISSVLGQSGKNEPEAATAALESLSLAPAEIEAVLRDMEQNRKFREAMDQVLPQP
jgi:hypothetical protein